MKKIKDHSAILLGILFSIALISAFVINLIGKNVPQGTIMPIGHSGVPINSIQGSMQTFAFMLCIIMVCIDCVVGARMAYFVSGYLVFSSLIAMIRTRQFGPLPGVFNGILVIISIILIGHLMRRAKKRSYTDYATGTFNTVGFILKLNKKMSKKHSVSLIYYQINNFRAINDDYGHDIGDKVLKLAASRMQKELGKDGFVGRIGGSEFAIVLNEGIDAENFAKEMVKSLNEKMVIDFNEMHIDIYVDSRAGIAAFPKDASEPNELFKCADIALIHAMKNRRHPIAVFDEQMLEKMRFDKEMEQLIKRAYNDEYFFVEYQPQFTIAEKKLRGFESLIRMKLPDGKRVNPGDFIPIAEKSNLIFMIDEFILNYVTKEFSSIVNEKGKDVVMSVNISANGFSRPEFVGIVAETLKRNNFPAQNLEIEITEYSFEESQDMTIANINKLKEIGVKVALDDFGTGYASLSRLMNLSVDLLKVDKSLVDNIEKEEVNRDFIKSIGTMGHLLGCEVILEGVESEQQIDYIKQLDCDFVQGYVWGKPMAFEDANTLI